LQQKKTVDKLIGLKAQKLAKLESIRRKELAQMRDMGRKFHAKENPHANHDTAEKIEKFINLEQRDPKRNMLWDFLAE